MYLLCSKSENIWFLFPITIVYSEALLQQAPEWHLIACIFSKLYWTKEGQLKNFIAVVNF